MDVNDIRNRPLLNSSLKALRDSLLALFRAHSVAAIGRTVEAVKVGCRLVESAATFAISGSLGVLGELGQDFGPGRLNQAALVIAAQNQHKDKQNRHRVEQDAARTDVFDAAVNRDR